MHNKRIGRDDLLKIEVGLRLCVQPAPRLTFHSGRVPRRLQAGALTLAVLHAAPRAGPSALHVVAPAHHHHVVATRMTESETMSVAATATVVTAVIGTARAAQTIVTVT